MAKARALDALDRVMQGKPGRPGKETLNNVKGFPAGNSESAALRRLRKERRDLHAQVLAGEKSAHAAMVEAGFRRKTVTVALEQSTASRWVSIGENYPELFRNAQHFSADWPAFYDFTCLDADTKTALLEGPEKISRRTIAAAARERQGTRTDLGNIPARMPESSVWKGDARIAADANAARSEKAKAGKVGRAAAKQTAEFSGCTDSAPTKPAEDGTLASGCTDSAPTGSTHAICLRTSLRRENVRHIRETGRLIARLPKSKGGRKTHDTDVVRFLTDTGLERRTAERWQALATRITDTVFDETIEAIKAPVPSLTMG